MSRGKMMKLRVNSKTIYICLSLLCLYLESFFQIAPLKYVDELIGIFSILYVLMLLLQNKMGKFNSMSRTTLVFISGMVLLGITSNIIFHYQYSWISVLLDVFTFVKPFMIFLAISCVCHNEKYSKSLSQFILKFSKIASVVIFITLIISCVFNIPSIAFYDSWANFKFLKTYVFFTKYPGQLAMLISSLIMVQIADYQKKHLKYIAMNIISIFFTQSGVGFIAIFLLITFCILKKNKKLKKRHLIMLIIGGVIVGYNEIYYYLLNSASARSVLLKYGFITAQKFFPLGAGFANYGGAVAASDYSRLYNEYNFGMYWGMGQNSEYDFLHDSYYPIIIGEFGFLGMAFYVAYLLKQFKFINNIKNNINLRYALLFSFSLVLVMNLGQGSFSGDVGCIFMVLFGVYFSRG